LAPNDLDWGLGRADLVRRPALSLPDIDNAGSVPAPAWLLDRTYKLNFADRLRRGLLDSRALRPFSRLVGAALLWAAGAIKGGGDASRITPARWFRGRLAALGLDSIIQRIYEANQKGDPGFYADDGFEPLRLHRDYFLFLARRYVKRGLFAQPFARFDLESCHAYVALVLMLQRRRPRRLLFLGRRNWDLSLLAMHVDPSLEITDCHENIDYFDWLLSMQIASRHARRHFANRHILLAPPGEAVGRLPRIPLVGDPHQCVCLELGLFQGSPDPLAEQAEKLAPILDPARALLIRGDGAARKLAGEALSGRGFRLAYSLPGADVREREAG
jgi:hypothetical protein